jgi:hypothetical protein
MVTQTGMFCPSLSLSLFPTLIWSQYASPKLQKLLPIIQELRLRLHCPVGLQTAVRNSMSQNGIYRVLISIPAYKPIQYIQAACGVAKR